VLLLKAGNPSAGLDVLSSFSLFKTTPETETNPLPQLNKEEAFPLILFLPPTFPFDMPEAAAACRKTEAAVVEQWNLMDEIECRMIERSVGNGLPTDRPTPLLT
jgi:hypothetical protein